MDSHSTRQLLDRPEEVTRWLRRLEVRDPERGMRALDELAGCGLAPAELGVLLGHLQRELAGTVDPDLALRTLARFVTAQRSPLAFVALVERDPESLTLLLRLLGSSPRLGSWLVEDPEALDLLRVTEGEPADVESLVDEMASELLALEDPKMAAAALRRARRREMLRIACGHWLGRQAPEVVRQQLAVLAEAVCRVAWTVAVREGQPRKGKGGPADSHLPAAILVALGPLGARQLDYDSPLTLLAVSEGPGRPEGAPGRGHPDPVELAVHRLQALLEEGEEEPAYQLVLHPAFAPRLAVRHEEVLRFYDAASDAGERHALVHARAIAGDRELAGEFLTQLYDRIYRRYRTDVDWWEMKLLAHQLRAGLGKLPVWPPAARPWLLAIEHSVSWLQMLHGGTFPAIRSLATRRALLKMPEASLMDEQTAERLVGVHDRLVRLAQAEFLAEDPDEPDDPWLRTRIARLADADARTADGYWRDLVERCLAIRPMLDQLLQRVGGGDTIPLRLAELIHGSGATPPDATSLSVYGFRDKQRARSYLVDLSAERSPFLSSRRCRYGLVRIAPTLLAAIAKTPDPDETLANLSHVSDSLGAKGVLWELLHASPASLQLYVDVCAASPYLSGILTSQPGMIDELMDSLVLAHLPTMEFMRRELDELGRGGQESEGLLHGFKNLWHLAVGVRDILGKDTIRQSTEALANIAELCLSRIAADQFEHLRQRHGAPMLDDPSGAPCGAAVVALGKLGGREPNYHSDHHLLFLYQGEGSSHGSREHRAVRNRQFFTQWAQGVLKAANRTGRFGRLYEVAPGFRTRPPGDALAMSLEELQQAFREGPYGILERQALCRARPLEPQGAFADEVREKLHELVAGEGLCREDGQAILAKRHDLQRNASPWNLKRAPGGTLDVEFAAQLVILRHAGQFPALLEPGTAEALKAAAQAGLLAEETSRRLVEAYRLLRGVEARLRLMDAVARHDLPEDTAQLRRLSYLLRYRLPQELQREVQAAMQQTRASFQEVQRQLELA